MRFRWLWLGLLMFAPAAWAGPAIMVFGDSLSAGYGIEVASGWVSLLQQTLARNHYDYDVVNASISGETTAGGLARIRAALAQRRPAVVIVELGGNDGLRGLPLEATEANLDGILAACEAARAKVLLVGMRLPPNYGAAYADRFHAMYAQVARARRAALLPFLLEGLAQDRASFQADGIHPTAAAQPLIARNVWTALRPLLTHREKAAGRGKS